MSLTARVKESLRMFLGDSATTTIHGWRFAYLARRTVIHDMEMISAVALAPKGCIALDVGANGADWTLALASRVGPNGRVYAFEANPYYAEATRKAIRSLRLSNVTLLPVAVGDRPGTVHLLVKERRAASFSGRAHIVTGDDDERGTTETVRMVRIDDVMAEHDALSSVGFLKSDTEGFELAVLRGAVKTMEASRPVLVIEVGHGSIHGFSDDDLESFLRQLRYRIHVYDAASDQLLQVESLASSATQHSQNRILVPKERDLSSLH